MKKKKKNSTGTADCPDDRNRPDYCLPRLCYGDQLF